MNAWVLLLRGINVGGRGKLPMAGLRDILTRLGVRNVATYIQSGNVVFTGVIDARAFGEIVEDEIEAQHGFRPRAMLLSRESFDEIAAGYPYPEAWADPTAGHIWFLAGAAQADGEALSALASPTERVALTDHALYLHAPDGIGRSKLADRAERLLGVPATARNLNTVAKLGTLLATLPKG